MTKKFGYDSGNARGESLDLVGGGGDVTAKKCMHKDNVRKNSRKHLPAKKKSHIPIKNHAQRIHLKIYIYAQWL